MQIPFRCRVKRSFKDDGTLAYLLAQSFQGGDGQVGVEANYGLAGRVLLVDGAVVLVGDNFGDGRKSHIKLKSALAQHFAADRLRV